MSRLGKLFGSPPPRPVRKARLGVTPLEAREVPATFTVTTTADVVSPIDFRLSLREAISRANANPGADVIKLPAGIFNMTRTGADNTNAGGDFDVSGSLTIVGAGPGSTVISGSHTERLFDVLGPGTMKFSNLALVKGGNGQSNGGAVQALSANIVFDHVEAVDNVGLHGGVINAEHGAVTVLNSQLLVSRAIQDGGAIRAGTGRVIVDQSTISGNDAPKGGGIFVGSGSLAVSRSTVQLNTAHVSGGGIDSEGGVVILTGATVHDNTTDGTGGGVFARGTVSAAASTVDHNVAALDGGGIRAATVNLTNSTISTNTAHRNGGGLEVTAGGGLLLNATIAYNHADVFGGGVHNLGGAVHVKNTIIAMDSAGQFGQDVLGLFDSQGHNLVFDPNSGNANTDFANPANQDILGVDPRLGALASNGGPTRTHALLAGSAAIDHATLFGAPAVDQRGVARPRDGDHNGFPVADIGAFEV